MARGRKAGSTSAPKKDVETMANSTKRESREPVFNAKIKLCSPDAMLDFLEKYVEEAGKRGITQVGGTIRGYK